METLVSLPDELFHKSESAARLLRLSQNQLYVKAISEFINRQHSEAVINLLNNIYERHPAKVGKEPPNA